MSDKWYANPAIRLLMNRAVIAIVSAGSGILFAAFPLQMAALCGAG